MTDTRRPTDPAVLARTLHLLVGLAALAGFAMELTAAVAGGAGAAPSHAERIVRLFSFFTIQSNILIGVVSLLLAPRPGRDGRIFRVVRLDALLCIAVTGIVFNTVLVGLPSLTSTPFSNFLLHTAAPVLAVVVWLWMGPRPRIDTATVWWSVAFPLAWLVYTFVRGAATGWYPYPFLDVTEIGLTRAILNAAMVAVVFLALAWGLRWADGRLRPVPGRVAAASKVPGALP
ncbi:Pr6Pr family membrane protein [Antribacter gilvus]|uniref:Pr6Pr family membrane protein n=1 Tax=Antribacter gilvus TaxID=2304675 RepID=UPI000F7B0BD3|nr:Pr6Pr family membrane protein [Antribacter gilvus]